MGKANEHYDILSGIMYGLGNASRPEDENPASVLAELRERVDLEGSASDMLFTLSQIAEFENSIARTKSLLESLLSELKE